MNGGCMRRVRPYEMTVMGRWRKIEVYIRGFHDPHFYQVGQGNRHPYNDKGTALDGPWFDSRQEKDVIS
jgi:hypothetical protein